MMSSTKKSNMDTNFYLLYLAIPTELLQKTQQNEGMCDQQSKTLWYPSPNFHMKTLKEHLFKT